MRGDRQQCLCLSFHIRQVEILSVVGGYVSKGLAA